MDLVGKTLGNRYEVLEEIGIGGMATVYKAKCKLLNRHVAVKVLKNEFSKDNEFVKKFRAEAQSAASLTHPNIVSVYDVGEEAGVNYIVMELLEGDTLKDYIEKKGKLNSETTLRFASQIASALEAAHKSKIIHRDIKPQNIVLTNNNIAKVTDFGIAKMSSKDTITSTTSTIGSVHYFSPEHAKGCYTDEKSDIYSLGVVMYEMVTGVLPFNADTAVSVALKQIQEVPKQPKDISPNISDNLNEIILKAMAKNTTERYQTATEILDDIFAAINNPVNLFVNKEKENFRKGGTQVVPIIGIKDDVKPSISDEASSETLGSRKMQRARKNARISEFEESEPEVDFGKGKKKEFSKKKKIIILSAITICFIIISVLAIKLAITISSNNKKIVSQVEVAPNLVGREYEEVKAEYEKLGLTIVIEKYENSTEYEEGKVVSQKTKHGDKITDDKISVVVSKGSKKVIMIDVVGKDYSVAKYELESLGFKPEFEFVINEKVEQNIIITQDINKGEEVAVESVIKIQVSKGNGKVMVIVPSVLGTKESNAVSKLTDLKLKVSVKYTTDNSKADGAVISQSLKENAEVEENSKIELTVNRLEKEKTISINVSSYVEAPAQGEEYKAVKVKVTAKIDEGVTNSVDTRTVEHPYSSYEITVNGFSKGTIYVYVDDKLVKTQSISF